MILVNSCDWVISIKEVEDQLEECQKARFRRFVDRHRIVPLPNNEVGIYKKDLDKFYRQFGYFFWDRINEE